MRLIRLKSIATEFFAVVESKFSSEAIKFVFGSILIGPSGFALAEGFGLATAIGVSVLTVKVIAIILLFMGLYIAIPILWKRAMDTIKENTKNLKLF